MRILFLFPHLLVPAQSGIYHTGLNIADGLKKLGHKPTIVRIGETTDSAYGMEEIIIPPARSKTENKITLGWGDLQLLHRAKKVLDPLVREHDVISIHGPTRLAWPAMSVARKYGQPVVMNYHGSEVIRYRRSIWPGWLKYIAARVTGGVFVSRRLLECAYMKGIAPIESTAIHPSLNPAFLASLPESRDHYRRKLGWDNKKVLLCVKRLLPVGGHETLISAFNIIHQNNPGTHLVVVGGGPEKNALKKLADSLGLSGAIEFKGVLAINDLPALYQAADLFVLASPFESFGLVTLQALVMGTPAVGTPTFGTLELADIFPEQITPTPDFTAEGLSTATLARLAEGPPRVPDETVHSIRQRFSPEQAGRAHAEFYVSLL